MGETTHVGDKFGSRSSKGICKRKAGIVGARDGDGP